MPEAQEAPRDKSWRQREASRLDSGEYKRPVWHEEAWVHDMRAAEGECIGCLHYTHVSREDPSMLAFTASEDHGELNRKTRMKPGRYLKRFYGDTGLLTDKQIAYYAEWFAKGARPSLPSLSATLHFAKTPEKIIEVYKHGPDSCMLGHTSVAAYGAGDLAIAYLQRKGEKKVLARALCWPEKKVFGRVYPNSGESDINDVARNALIVSLEREGFRDWDSTASSRRAAFEGARLLARSAKKGKNIYSIPYFDGSYGFSWAPPKKGEKPHFVMAQAGDYRGAGNMFVTAPDVVCAHCEKPLGRTPLSVYTRYSPRDMGRPELWHQECFNANATGGTQSALYRCALSGYYFRRKGNEPHAEDQGPAHPSAMRWFMREGTIWRCAKTKKYYFLRNSRPLTMASGALWSQEAFDTFGYFGKDGQRYAKRARKFKGEPREGEARRVEKRKKPRLTFPPMGEPLGFTNPSRNWYTRIQEPWGAQATAPPPAPAPAQDPTTLALAEAMERYARLARRR